MIAPLLRSTGLALRLWCTFISFFIGCLSTLNAQNSLSPSIAITTAGTLCLVNATSAPDARIVLTLCDSIGSPHAKTIVVNDGMPGHGIHVSAAAGANADVLLAWEQDLGSMSQVWCARYTATGVRVGQAVRVTDSAAVNAKLPRIAAGRDGRCVVAWQDYRNQVPDLRYQLFDSRGAKVGPNHLLAAYPGIPFYPVPAVSASNQIAFVYQQTIKDTFHVCVRFAQWNERVGKVTILDQARNRAYSTNPDLVWIGGKELVAVWKDYRSRNSDIYLQRLTSAGKLVGANRRVNDDTTKQWQRLPRIAVNDSLLCIVWEDYRNDPRNQLGDIYCQWYRCDGSPLLKNVRVNTSPEPSPQNAPSVALDKNGRAEIVWCDSQSGTVTLSGRLFGRGEEGVAIGAAEPVHAPLK
jgi:hypothetical protein